MNLYFSSWTYTSSSESASYGLLASDGVEKDMAWPCQKKGLWHLWPALGWAPSEGSFDFSRNFSAWIPDSHDEIPARVRGRIWKQHTWLREPLEEGLKLAVTLRHLVAGTMYSDMQYGWRVPENTVVYGQGGVSGYMWRVCRWSDDTPLRPRWMETTWWWILQALEFSPLCCCYWWQACGNQIVSSAWLVIL